MSHHYGFRLISFSTKFAAHLCYVLIALTPMINAAPVAIPIGPPIAISPGPASPDPVLQNLNFVMNEFFQPPYYPGGSPDYLSQIYYQSQYPQSGHITISPVDDRIMNVAFGQNYILDNTSTFFSMIASNTLATSFDRGHSWHYGPPVEQSIALGGTISQLINSSIGPGLSLRYAKNGKLYAFGQGFDDLHPNPPFPVPQTGLLFSVSEDNGRTWTPPKVIARFDADWWFLGPPYGVGIAPWDFYINIHPANSNFIFGTCAMMLYPGIIWSNLSYTSSYDGGRNFSPLRTIYSMVDDPLWQAENFDPEFTSDPNYFTYGGECFMSDYPLVYDQNILMQTILRVYPKPGSSTYSSIFPSDTDFDQAIVRSLDNGETWCKVAGHTDKYFFVHFPHDPGYLDASHTFGDTASQGASAVISPFTGRIYLAYEAGNPASDPDPDIAINFPFILLSVSSDKGVSFSRAVQINQTPTNIPAGAQQAFAHDMIMTQDGYLCVGYYDLRNWTGFSGENIQETPLQTDCWLDIYREIDDPNGGSTGVGLDFVQEIRLTPQSFNARIGTESAINFATSTSEGMRLSVNSRNEVFALFSMTNPNVTIAPTIVENSYLGMTVDTTIRYTDLLQRIQFPKPSNQ